MNSKEPLVAALKRHLRGEVRDDPMSRHIYSADASILDIKPKVVVLPATSDDLSRVVEIAQEFNVPITARGGGSGIAGGCLGEGIIVDTSKYLTRILECDHQAKFALCEPGVIQDDLNAYAAPFRLRLGADTSTGNRATLGGMCATNAAGSHYLKYGNMIDHVLAVEMVLSTGKTVWLDETTSWEGLPEVTAKDTFHRSSSGYPLYILNERVRNLAKLTVGSEGTLGIFSKIKVKLSPVIEKSTLALFPFAELEEALAMAEKVKRFSPVSLELIDEHIIAMGRLSPLLKGKLNWLQASVKALLIAEFESGSPPAIHPAQINVLTRSAQEEIWTLRKAGLGLLLSRRSYSRSIAFIEDLAVPPERLVEFIGELKKIVPFEMGIYGHVGDGCLHTRPYVKVSDPNEMSRIFEVMPGVSELVKKMGGTLTSEHGDGVIRSWLNPAFFGKEATEAMLQVKKAFDPFNLMNPGKIVQGKMPLNQVRISKPRSVPTFLNFSKEGGLHLAADLCNGNGACRKTSGLMCPSFQAYRDERHTTRARAVSLKAVLNGELPLKELTEEGLLDVLDYCLQCKGCKKECPSQVDMAKMKSEILYQYQKKHGFFLKSQLLGRYHTLAAMASKCPSLTNWLAGQKWVRKTLSLAGITEKRPFPKLASRRFSARANPNPSPKKGEKVHLFIDTFTEFHAPEIGEAALQVLEKLGYSVSPTLPICCGRPLLSVGMLEEAQTYAARLAHYLSSLEGPILVLEPSCLSAMIDDYPSLDLPQPKVMAFEAFLTHLKFEDPIFYHPHCHEQALTSIPLREIFPQMVVSRAGCCGLAGGFGFEKNHYDMSIKIGENQLFPQIIQHELLPLAASGFSCREQIHHALGKRAYHPAQLILNNLY